MTVLSRFCASCPLAAVCMAALMAASLLLAVPGRAELADRNKPMNIEADALRHDNASQTSVFTGNVVITKGTILIKGQRVQIQQDAQGNQVSIVEGSPAFFRQKRDVPDEFIQAQSQRMDYDSKTQTLRFVGQAVLQRYKGTQVNDETSGAVITYHTATDVFSVESAGKGTPSSPKGRVRAMLTPAPKEEGTPAPAPAVPLRPSPQMRPPPP